MTAVARERGTRAFQQIMIDGKMVPTNINFTTEAGGPDVCEVEICVADCGGNPVPGSHALDVYFSDSVDGLGLTTNDVRGVTVKEGSGTLIAETVSSAGSKAFKVVTGKDGKVVLEITDEAHPSFRVVSSIPSLGLMVVSVPLIDADYGE